MKKKKKTVRLHCLTLNGVVPLHLGLVVVLQTVDRLSLHVLPLVALSIHCEPGFLQLLLGHLDDSEGEKLLTRHHRILWMDVP